MIALKLLPPALAASSATMGPVVRSATDAAKWDTSPAHVLRHPVLEDMVEALAPLAEEDSRKPGMLHQSRSDQAF